MYTILQNKTITLGPGERLFCHHNSRNNIREICLLEDCAITFENIGKHKKWNKTFAYLPFVTYMNQNFYLSMKLFPYLVYYCLLLISSTCTLFKQVMKDTATILKQHHYPTKFRDIIPVKGIAEPQKVYTILKPSDTGSNPLSQRRGSMAVAAPSMKTFNDVVQKLMKSPSTRHRLKQDSMDEPDSAVSKPL